MKIALAQIDVRLGDIEGVCSRIESQVALAAERGAQLLCVPAPLFAGILPGALIECADYEHDLLAGLQRVAAAAERAGVICLVPAPISYDGSPLFEIFLLKDGRVVPARLTLARRREGAQADLWTPPAFDVAGTRVVASLDFDRDIEGLPSGCDLFVYFQVNGFDASNEPTVAVASVPDGHFVQEVARASVWMACMAPVGGFDEATYTGGSFVMDDGGHVVAASPCFSEDLLVQEVSRGIPVPALPARELPAYNREEWLWEALRLQLSDAVAASGTARALVALSGDLPSSLLAALAVDALGPRNVIGLFSERPDALTPAGEARERERAAAVRELAANLHIRLVERPAADLNALLGAGAPAARVSRLRLETEALLFADTAFEQRAFPLSAMTKTEAALAPAAPRPDAGASLAPFGDIYLTSLEFLARFRNRASSVLPAHLVTLRAVEEGVRAMLACAGELLGGGDAYAQEALQVLSALEPAQIDGALEAHVDRSLDFDESPLAGRFPQALALLCLLVRRGESTRRCLPSAPIVSARSFSERSWPRDLAWSDLGLQGASRLRADDLARAEIERGREQGDVQGQRARSEILGLLGGLLGISPEQQRELQSEEGRRRIQENMQRFEDQLQEALGRMFEGSGTSGSQRGGDSEGGLPFGGDVPPGVAGGGIPFFSQN